MSPLRVTALLAGFVATLSSAGSSAADPADPADPGEAVDCALPALQKVDRLHLDDVHPGVDNQRVVDLYLRALTQHGDPVDCLRPVDLEIRQDGERIDPEHAAVEIMPLSRAKRGVACVLAIDRSRTMMGGAFERARQAAVAFLDKLGSHDRAAVVTFAQTVEVVAPFEAPPAEVRTRLEELEVDQSGLSTLLYDGVYEALELIRRGGQLPRRSLVIVFSDGKDSGSDRDRESVVELARSSRILVYTIGYARFGGGGLPNLRELALETGADFERMSSAQQPANFYEQIWNRVMRSYVVRFEAPMDGQAHTLEVAVENRSDARQVRYPEIAGPVWPWLAGAGGVLFVVVGLAAFLQLRSAGRLVFVDGPRNGEVVPLRNGVMRIGAISSNDIVIPSVTVSRYHAELRVRARRVEIKDLHSENGTRINGNDVDASPLQVTPGDRIQIADVDLVFER